MKSIFRPFPLPLTGRQKFYLFVLQGLGAGIIDGGANFGIAYAMYGKQEVVKMWIFSQNTIAGDLGVTPIIQCLASMIISSTLVHTDLHNSKIKPLAFVYPHVENLPDPRSLFGRSGVRSDALRGVTTDDAATVAGSASASVSDEKRRVKRSGSDTTTTAERHGLSYYYWMLVRFIFEGTEQNMLLAKPGLGAWFGRLAWTAAQGAAIGIVFGFPLWCLAIVILGPIYRMDNMGSRWAPQVIKGVYGAIVGWVTNPVIAVLALGSQAEQSLLVVPVDEEREISPSHTEEEDVTETQEELTDGTQVGGVQTIPEDEVLEPPGVMRPTAGSRRTSSAAGSFRLPPVPVTPGRSRAGSGAESYRSTLSSSVIHTRPPLTANTSWLSPLPSPSVESSGSHMMGTGRSRARSNADPAGYTLAPPLSPVINRQRGATVSHPATADSLAVQRPPTTPRAGTLTPRTFSYALGGSGGRAQRSRSGSVVSQVPSVLLSSELGGGEESVGGMRSRQASTIGDSGTGVWGLFARRESAVGVTVAGEKVKEG